jgi:RimJ/RimL family protein N-acetyltransferase
MDNTRDLYKLYLITVQFCPYLTMFVTDRLILRPFRIGDLEDMLHLWNDPLVQRCLTSSGVIPRAPKFKDKISGFVDSALFYVIITMKETGAFMGMCNIWLEGDNAKNRDGRMGISISPEYWNKGYGTEVLKFVVDYSFRWLALHRVSLRVFESNKGAIASYEKLWVPFLVCAAVSLTIRL